MNDALARIAHRPPEKRDSLCSGIREDFDPNPGPRTDFSRSQLPAGAQSGLSEPIVSRRRAWQALAVVACCLGLSVRGGAESDDAPPDAAAGADERPSSAADEQPPGKAKYTTQSLRGQVVWMADALRDRFGIETDDDVAHAVVALEDEHGQLHPLLKDTRGRSFHSDERLRNIDLELLVRRYPGSPAVQVVRVYAIKPDGKYQVDYWCDVCSIAMYELKPCECCQGPTRLRERRVADEKAVDGEKKD